MPHGLAIEPTETNKRALAEARKHAEVERERMRAELVALAERLNEVEVTVRARANEQGHLYGSVGPREVSAALREEGYPVDPDQVLLPDHLRQLDNVAVDIRLGEGLSSSVKVWVVREKTEEDIEEEEAAAAELQRAEARSGREAGRDEQRAGD